MCSPFVAALCVCYVLSSALDVSNAQGRAIHRSPCPNIFEYRHDGQKWFGSITVPGPKYGTQARLHVTMSLAAKLPTQYSGSIELAGGKNEILNNILNGSPITYIVNFPLLWPIPKMTEIIFNGNKVCSGPPEMFSNGVYTLTDITLDHTLNSGDEAGNVYYPTFQDIPNQGNYWPGQPAPNNGQGDDAVESFYEMFLNNGQQPPVTQQTFPPPRPTPPLTRPTQPPSRPTPPPSRPTPPPTRPTMPPTPPPVVESRPSVNVDYSCGNPRVPNPLVVYGDTTEKGIWPWMTAMYIGRPERVQFNCAGTLISNQHVVTAAACMTDPNSRRRLTIHNVLIKLGVFNLQDWSDENRVQTTLSAIHVHPSYNKPKMQNDIALLTLVSAVSYSDYVIPICTWDTDDNVDLIEGRFGTVVGWGRDENGEARYLEPRMAKLPLISTATCRSKSTKHFPLTGNATLCAGGRDGVGPCNGDSGTGVYYFMNSKWYLRGVVSNALADKNGICDLSEYVVLTDVAKFMPWILSLMEQVTK